MATAITLRCRRHCDAGWKFTCTGTDGKPFDLTDAELRLSVRKRRNGDFVFEKSTVDEDGIICDEPETGIFYLYVLPEDVVNPGATDYEIKRRQHGLVKSLIHGLFIINEDVEEDEYAS